MKQQKFFDVFVSYSSKDIETATKIRDKIESEGLICWMAPRDVTGGIPYAREIISAIKNSTVVLFIFSGNSVISNHVYSEIDAAFNNQKVIIPYRIQNVSITEELSYYIQKIHQIDGLNNTDDEIDILLTTIRKNIPRLSNELQFDETLRFLSNKYGASIDSIRQALDNIKVSDTRQKSSYDILRNNAGEILLIIGINTSEKPTTPLFIWDGTSRLLLHRNHESTIYFEDLALEAMNGMYNLSHIHVIEIGGNEEVAHHYVALIHLTDNINRLIGDEWDEVKEERLFNSLDLGALSGNPMSQHKLGYFYSQKHDFKKAYDWYKQAAENGFKHSQHKLGLMLEKGSGVKKDVSKALHWFTKAAQNGHIISQYFLGMKFMNGEDVNKDIKEAVKWLNKCAKRGWIPAKYALGKLYFDGTETEINYRKAIRYFIEAAELGHIESQLILRDIYDRGIGLKPNHKKALMWHETAMAQINTDGITNINMTGSVAQKDFEKLLEEFIRCH